MLNLGKEKEQDVPDMPTYISHMSKQWSLTIPTMLLITYLLLSSRQAVSKSKGSVITSLVILHPSICLQFIFVISHIQFSSYCESYLDVTQARAPGAWFGEFLSNFLFVPTNQFMLVIYTSAKLAPSLRISFKASKLK